MTAAVIGVLALSAFMGAFVGAAIGAIWHEPDVVYVEASEDEQVQS